MNIEIAIQNFILTHESVRASQHTLRNYKRSLKRFAAWLQAEHGIVDTDSLGVSHLRGWMSNLQKAQTKEGKGLSDGTIHFYGVSMLAFCHWLENEEVLPKPITARFKLPRVEKKFIPTFTPDEVSKLLAACEEGDKRKPQLRKALTSRNRAILSVFIDTGIRLSELAGLRLSDVDRDYHLLIVHRKGNKWQQVPISHDGFKPLHDYLTKHRPYLAKLGGRMTARKDDPVFLTYAGEGISIDGLSGLFKRLRKRTEIEGKRVSAHNCRRYMATTQLALGRSPLDVQRQMGHTTLAMTNHYASLNIEHLRKSHEMYSPLRVKSVSETLTLGTGYWDE